MLKKIIAIINNCIKLIRRIIKGNFSSKTEVFQLWIKNSM